MKSYIVFSDIHGDRYSLQKLKSFTENNNGAFFAGDGICILKGFTQKQFYAVRGNCDFTGEKEITVEIDGVKILLTHGDLYGVKSSCFRLLMRAKELECKVVIFGHTHQTFIEEIDGVLMINPGTCSYYTDRKTYAVLTIQDQKATAYINEIK